MGAGGSDFHPGPGEMPRFAVVRPLMEELRRREYGPDTPSTAISRPRINPDSTA